jgi:hypothetical protein
MKSIGRLLFRPRFNFFDVAIFSIVVAVFSSSETSGVLKVALGVFLLGLSFLAGLVSSTLEFLFDRE